MTVCWCVYGKCDASIGKEHAWNTNVLQFAECKKALQFVMINLWQNMITTLFVLNMNCLRFSRTFIFARITCIQGGYFKMRFFSWSLKTRVLCLEVIPCIRRSFSLNHPPPKRPYLRTYWTTLSSLPLLVILLNISNKMPKQST